MKMTSIKMKKKLEERLYHEDWRTSYNRDKDTFRVEWEESNQGVTITLPNVISKFEQRGEAALDELENHIRESFKNHERNTSLNGQGTKYLSSNSCNFFSKENEGW